MNARVGNALDVQDEKQSVSFNPVRENNFPPRGEPRQTRRRSSLDERNPDAFATLLPKPTEMQYTSERTVIKFMRTIRP